MSADNTIVILSTPTTGIGFEYRVAHVQNAEELYNIDQGYHADFVTSYFNKAKCFDDIDAAEDYAFDLEDKVGYVEYGVEIVNLPNPYNHYRDLSKGERLDYGT